MNSNAKILEVYKEEIKTLKMKIDEYYVENITMRELLGLPRKKVEKPKEGECIIIDIRTKRRVFY